MPSSGATNRGSHAARRRRVRAASTWNWFWPSFAPPAAGVGGDDLGDARLRLLAQRLEQRALFRAGNHFVDDFGARRQVGQHLRLGPAQQERREQAAQAP